nr:Maf family protein [Variibacter gotjawalensis]
MWRLPEPLILASGSSVRRQLLTNAGIPVDVHPANIDERAIEKSASDLSPPQLAARLAHAKGEHVAQQFPSRVVLAADQTMACGDRVYHKPTDLAAAHAQITSLLGRTHELHAAIALFANGRCVFEGCETARLTMRDATPDFVGRYLDLAGEKVFTSVGGYQLEGIGVQLFEKIEGDYFTILGLPLLPLLKFLQSKQYVVA